MTRDQARRHADLWKGLLTRAPEGTQAPAASLAGFGYWIAGDGLSARAALERIPPGQDYPLARLLTATIRHGLDPTDFPMPSRQPPDPASVTGPSTGRGRSRREPPRPSAPGPTPGVSR